MSQLREDLINRIKEKHDVWFRDSVNLYEMAGLKPAQAANDTITIMTFNIVWLLEQHSVDMDDFIKEMRRTLKVYRKTREP